MAIVVQQEPSTRNWSGNPIHYRLYSAAAAGDASIYFEIKIKFKRTDASVYTEVVTLPYYPFQGVAKIDIQDVLDGLMEYEMPTLPQTAEYTAPLFARKMTGAFYIAYREITTAEPDPAWTDTEPELALMVIKGGISFEKWRGDNFWTNYFDVALPFLTWQLNGRLASLNERMYLAWYNHSTAGAGFIKMRRKITYTDGTIHSADLDCPALAKEVVFFPSGAAQLELETVIPDKKILFWTMQVWDIENTTPLSEVYKYNVDNRYDRNEKTFNFRNSLGGLDSARVRGSIEDNADRKYQEQESIVQHNYFEGYVILPRVKQADSTELLASKADIGFVTKEEQDRLREIHHQRECWWEQQNKWLPISIVTGSAKLRLNSDMLWSMPIEYSIATKGDHYYTPQSVDLAEGVFTSPSLCNAVIDGLNVVFADGVWTATWELISGAPVRYEISTPAISGGVPITVTALTHIYDWLPLGDSDITVRPICQVGSEFYPGAPQTVTVTNGAVCTPVSVPGTASLPQAVKDVPYNHSIALSGSAPFALADITKPAWMTVAIVGSNIVFSGTPTALSAGTTVSYTVSNCTAANFIYIATPIAVVDPDLGSMHVEVILLGASITNIVGFAYSLSSGSLPVNNGQVADGTHGVKLTGDIDVTVSSTDSGHLDLYVNGAQIKHVAFLTGGVITLEDVVFEDADDISFLIVP